MCWCVYVCVWQGLGTLYGDSDLQDQMDSAAIMKTVESTLWKHFDRFVYVYVTFTVHYLPHSSVKTKLYMIDYTELWWLSGGKREGN